MVHPVTRRRELCQSKEKWRLLAVAASGAWRWVKSPKSLIPCEKSHLGQFHGFHFFHKTRCPGVVFLGKGATKGAAGYPSPCHRQDSVPGLTEQQLIKSQQSGVDKTRVTRCPARRYVAFGAEALTHNCPYFTGFWPFRQPFCDQFVTGRDQTEVPTPLAVREWPRGLALNPLVGALLRRGDLQNADFLSVALWTCVQVHLSAAGGAACLRTGGF